jgi:pimeloyl-ACP methyl ester carboxylesterase
MLIGTLALAAGMSFAPCTVDKVEARCATFVVPEDQGNPAGRTIGLRVVVLPATGKATVKATAEPLFVLAGGPGQAASQLTGFIAETFAGIRGDRDIVLFDQRGTGGSNGLKCDMGSGLDLFPADRVVACAKELATRADLRMYTTAEAVKDLDDVRRALGWKQIDLFGTSYGTRVALEYVRAYPESVRAVIVKGTVPPQLRYTVDPQLDTQASIERVTTLVSSFRDDVMKAMAALPVEGMTRELFGVEIRNSLHSIPGIEELPRNIHAAANGDWTIFAKAAATHLAALKRDVNLGMYFSVTCAEDVWRVSDAEAKRIAGPTVPGDYWHRQLAGACAVWPHAPAQRTVATPFRSKVPALIISGAFDPVTPPRAGEFTAKILTNSRHVVIPNASHSFARLTGCVDVMMAKFVIDPQPKNVDESCVKDVKPPVFK